MLDMLGPAERALSTAVAMGMDGEFHLLAIVCSGRERVSSGVHTDERAVP
jgi:hypothetical protein